MSANDQILIKKYKGKYYTFSVMAESWSKTNPLKLSTALEVFDDFKEAYQSALNFTHEWGYAPEYDPSVRLVKDGANVRIINDMGVSTQRAEESNQYDTITSLKSK